jgi:HPt (histidine-containing phosphotransfer) domain-containing protein
MKQETKQPSPICSDLATNDPMFFEVVQEFVDCLPRRLGIMERALRAADFDALREAAHQLNGSGGACGYPILTEKARMLEHCAIDRETDECLDAYKELQEICSRIVVTSPKEHQSQTQIDESK